MKQGKATTVQDLSVKYLTEERQILNRWTEYCSKLYNYKANGDPSGLNCPQTDTEDDHPILRRKVEAYRMLACFASLSLFLAICLLALSSTQCHWHCLILITPSSEQQIIVSVFLASMVQRLESS